MTIIYARKDATNSELDAKKIIKQGGKS